MARQSTRTQPSVGTLRTCQTSHTHSIPAIISLQTYSTHKKTDLDKEGYICTLCWRTFEKPCHTVGSDSRIVCWACGEVVFRKEDAVSFGWCWWHWGCFSCLVCSVRSSAHLGQSFVNVTGTSDTSFLSRHLWKASHRRHKPP
jgi:DNA-directed RNA polymerase subunit RPC12/RpoP